MNNNELFERALQYAAKKHEGQVRKNGTPYILHPVRIATMMQWKHYDITCQVVALLHDVLEDTDATDDEIKEFGEEVYEAVKAITHYPAMSDEEYVNRVLANHTAATVKQFDIIDNCCEAHYNMPFEDEKRFDKKYAAKYKRKFSSAVDCAVIMYTNHNFVDDKTGKVPEYKAEDYKLYCDKEKEYYLYYKDLYEKCTDLPDLTRDDIRVWRNSFGGYFFCFYQSEHDKNLWHYRVWSLGKAGWLPMKESPFHLSEYGDDLYPHSVEDVKNFIEKKKAEGNYFYDFVDVSKL